MTQATLNVIDYYISNDFCRGGNGEDEGQLLEERRLVAAAPDLLAALIAVTACLRGFHAADDFGPLDDEAIDAALDAISRAKGLDQ